LIFDEERQVVKGTVWNPNQLFLMDLKYLQLTKSKNEMMQNNVSPRFVTYGYK